MTKEQTMPTGQERDEGPCPGERANHNGPVIEVPPHAVLTAVRLVDQTDVHSELVHTERYLLAPTEPLELTGNLFFVESRLEERGWIFLKEAPLPHARERSSPVDLSSAAGGSGFRICLHQDDGYPWHVLEHEAGPVGRAVALQEFQRSFRPGLPVRFITNTWGDRSRDSRINEAFLLREIEAAARLGADLVQMDDGWQRGRTVNAAAAQKEGGGVWEGFYETDPDFWTPHPERFPNGLAPVAEAARAAGLGLGIWFAPDSCRDFANWERDAETILGLWRDFGAVSFKLDSINLRSAAGERNLKAMVERIRSGSGGEIVLDLDVTALRRPGYLSLMECGTVFVENRYTDWRNYWPHSTLRNLWSLAHYIDPRRLRMEFLNNARNGERYGDDPLAPGVYDPAYLFATVCFAQPLGWFEASNLPESYFGELPDLVRTWRQHRESIAEGTIVPVGEQPDGTGWTGFLSLDPAGKGGYLLVFRETNNRDRAWISLPPGLGPDFGKKVEWIHAPDKAGLSIQDGVIHASLPGPRSFALVRLRGPDNPSCRSATT